jgi:hypothetical protein
VSGRRKAGLAVGRDALNIFHQRRHIFKNAIVDPLQEVANGRTGWLDGEGKGIVDVPAPVRLPGDKFSGQTE